jgi:hypothetical protein
MKHILKSYVRMIKIFSFFFVILKLYFVYLNEAIGHSLHRSIEKNLDQKYQTLLQSRENELRESFEKELNVKLGIERTKLKMKTNQIETQMKREYERLLKDKVVEMEIYIQNIAKEQIELNKAEARKRLEETIDNMNSQFENEKKILIEKTVQSEASIWFDFFIFLVKMNSNFNISTKTKGKRKLLKSRIRSVAK